MAGKRQDDIPLAEKIAAIFVHEHTKRSGEIIQQLHSGQGMPLKEVAEGHVLASFELLEQALRARGMYEGRMPPNIHAAPSARIRERERLFHEIMHLISVELDAIDTQHTYRVGIAKIERRGPQSGFPL